MDPQIRQVVELLFARRLEQFRAEIANHSHADDGETTALARGAVVAAYGDVFRSYCSRLLRDYISLLELFDALAVTDALPATFSAHVDEAAGELLTTLGASGHADRNRVTNTSASIKLEANHELREASERARRARQRGADVLHELDDRLPLGRRGAFDRDLDRAVTEAERDGEPFALMMIDIDHFKRVNDVHGHPVGDEVLVDVARLVVTRAQYKGAAYRFGGEEFSLLLPGYSPEEAAGLAERIRKDLEQVVVSSKKLSVTASFGVAGVPDHATTAEAILAEADRALYDAKQGGRNRVAVPTA